MYIDNNDEGLVVTNTESDAVDGMEPALFPYDEDAFADYEDDEDYDEDEEIDEFEDYEFDPLDDENVADFLEQMSDDYAEPNWDMSGEPNDLPSGLGDEDYDVTFEEIDPVEEVIEEIPLEQAYEQDQDFDCTEMAEDETDDSNFITIEGEIDMTGHYDMPLAPQIVPETGETIVQDDSIFDQQGDIVVMDISGDAFDFAYIDVADIVVTDRIRKSTTVDALRTSINKTGLLKPIVVAKTATDGVYALVDGYKRVIACAKCGLTRIPCIINNKIKTTDLSILEALYNHYTPYTVKEIIDYISYLEKDKGIQNQSTIELLLQMEPGHYPKLKDVLNDNDPAILEKLLDGKITIDQAFNKLKSKRAKQSREEKELQTAASAFNTEESEGVNLETPGDIGTGEALTDQEIADLGVTPNLLDVTDKSVEDLLQEGDTINGFEDKVQKVGEREYIDPAMRKAVMARDNNTCQCCFEGGESYVDVNDFHHILPVFLGGPDTVDNAVCLCVKCHKLVHLHARGQLHLPPMDSLDEANKNKFKLILSYGNYIRKGMEKQGVKLDDYKQKDHINKIGRQMPGTKNTVG